MTSTRKGLPTMDACRFYAGTVLRVDRAVRRMTDEKPCRDVVSDEIEQVGEGLPFGEASPGVDQCRGRCRHTPEEAHDAAQAIGQSLGKERRHREIHENRGRARSGIRNAAVGFEHSSQRNVPPRCRHSIASRWPCGPPAKVSSRRAPGGPGTERGWPREHLSQGDRRGFVGQRGTE